MAVIKIIRKNIPYYALCCAIIGITAVIYHRVGPDKAMRYILAPYAKCVELFMNIYMSYIEGVGYSTPGLLFTIGENCSGLNYMAALFGMTGIMFVHKLPENRKLLWVALCAPGSAAVGVVMTALRIIGSIPIVGYARFSTLHAGIGISFYLAGMILCYLAAENVLRRMGRVIADG